MIWSFRKMHKIYLKIIEIQDLKNVLVVEFGQQVTNPLGPINLTPGDINRDNYITLASQYGANLTDDLHLPEEELPLYQASEPQHWTDDQSGNNEPQYFTLEIDVPEGYEIKEATRYIWFQPNNSQTDSDDHWQVYADPQPWSPPPGSNQSPAWPTLDPKLQPLMAPLPKLTGKFGKVDIMYGGRYLRSLYVEVHGTLTLRDDTIEQWQFKIWSAIRDAAQARYTEHLRCCNKD